MSRPPNVGTGILAAQERHCAHLAALVSAARAAGAPAAEIADLEAQEIAARRRYRELAVDLPDGARRGIGPSDRRRPWWRFW